MIRFCFMNQFWTNWVNLFIKLDSLKSLKNDSWFTWRPLEWFMNHISFLSQIFYSKIKFPMELCARFYGIYKILYFLCGLNLNSIFLYILSVSIILNLYIQRFVKQISKFLFIFTVKSHLIWCLRRSKTSNEMKIKIWQFFYWN